jgi:hypothetical protein
MGLPNFLIVGAAKCGTTSLFDQINKHKEVFTPKIKEPGFLIPQNQHSSIDSLSEYQKLFNGSEKYKRAGEASVTYLYDSASPGLIKDLLGEDVKIIIILRNQIEMAYSLWKHRQREQKEELDFFQAIEKWSDRSRDEAFLKSSIAYDWNYIGRAQFYPQVKRYLDNFKYVKIVFFEDYVKSNALVFQEICQFLGIDDSVQIEPEMSNKAFKPKSKGLQKLLSHRLPVKDILKRILPHGLLAQLKSKIEELNKMETEKENLSQESRKFLIPYFQKDVQALSTLLKRDLKSIWKDFE